MKPKHIITPQQAWEAKHLLDDLQVSFLNAGYTYRASQQVRSIISGILTNAQTLQNVTNEAKELTRFELRHPYNSNLTIH